MFQKSAFGSTPAGGSAFGTSAFGSTQPAFGQPTPTAGTSAFGTAAPAFGAPAAQAGGLFGSTSTSTSGGGLFGSTAPVAATGTTGFTGFGGTGSAFGTNSAFRPPASNFGATNTSTFGANPGTSTGLFGATTQASSGGLFGATQPGTTSFTGGNTFGSTNNAFTMGANQQQVVGTTIKFNPPTGNDTMMKSGTQQSIQTRHLCITCMKEYENKSIEELRCEDYVANRKGGTGATTGTTGLFGAAPNQTAPAGTSLFGATPAASQANPFGAQVSKPMFGAQTTTAGFGATSTPFGGQGTSAFGTSTSTSGGLFGAKPQTSFGQPSSSSGFSFGQTTATPSAAGSLFGQNNQAKPFGVAAPQASGGLFGSTTPAFGTATSAAPAFGATNNAFGQPAAQNQSINLFGQQQKPASAFGTPFGQTATTSAPSFGGFGQSTATTAPFGQAKPAFGGFGTTATSSAPGFGAQPLGAFGTATSQQQPASGSLFGAQKPGTFNFNSTSQPSSGAFNIGGTTGGFGTSTGGLFGANTQKPGGLFGATSTAGGAFGSSTGFGTAPTGGFGSSLAGGFGTTSTPFGGGFNSTPGMMQQPAPALGQAPSAASGGSVHDYLSSLTANPYGDDPLFKNLVPGSQSDSHLEEILKPTNPAAQKALLLAGNQYKISPHRNVKVKPKPISSLTAGPGTLKSNLSTSNSPLFDGLEDDDIMNSKNDLFVPRRSVKKLVIKPKSPGHQTNGIEARPLSRAGLQGINITNDDSVADGICNADDTNKADDVSLNLPPVVGKDGILPNGVSPATRNVEGSFLDTRSKKIDQLNNSSSPASLSVSVPSTTSTPMISSERAKVSSQARSPINSDRNSVNKKQPPSTHICTSEESVLLNDSDNDSEDQRALMEDGEEDENDQSKHPAKIQLKRSQYYTMPPFSELASITDSNGDCIVENFVIGRAGYGNIFFPGMTNIAGMNFDELVIFRHKEVFVYPDDSVKPLVGEGLNKKAQVTLDKVWPIDKTVQNPIKSPEKLVDMNYEEKLRKACIKMGARFTEYRPETGSWVFNVEHFSKYGLQDSDDEDETAVTAKKGLEGQKRFKTLQLRSDPSIAPKTADQAHSGVTGPHFMDIENYKPKESFSSIDNKRGNVSATETSFNKTNSESNRLSVNVPCINRDDFSNDVIGTKVKMMKAASLFDNQRDMDIDGGIPPPNVDISKMLVQSSYAKKTEEPRPIILESRSTKNGKHNTSSSVLERRDIEDIAHSILTGSSIGNRGLGGNYSMEAAPPTLATSLLRTQYLSSASMNLSTGVPNATQTPSRSLRFSDRSNNALGSHHLGVTGPGRTPSKKLPRYSLQSGYDKYVALPTTEQVSNQQFNRPKVVAPQHVDTLLPLKECIMNPSSIKLLADSGLYMSRSFRVGWSNHWVLANPGNSIQIDGIEEKGPTEVLIEQHITSSFGIVDQEQLSSLEDWLEVCLDHSNVTLEKSENDLDCVPLFESNDGIDMLTAFAEEANQQAQVEGSNEYKSAKKEIKQVWDLMVALWGRLPYLPENETSEMDDSFGEHSEVDGHEMTMRRKEALSTWLETVVLSHLKEDVHLAKLLQNKEKSLIAEEIAYLSGNHIKEACDRAQLAGDHYSAILTAQSAGGATSFSSQMLFKYMELLQEANADTKLAEDRLHLYSLISGTPVWWRSENSKINTLNDLDWKRAFAVTLWFLSTPSSSIADALAEYESAFLGHPQYGQYAAAPRPTYENEKQAPSDRYENHDIKFQLLKLYSDRSHGLENIITPATYTNDELDHRLGWFVGQVLSSLGYRHLSNSRRVQLHSEFASQLESLGLWQWSVFVLLHLNYDERNSQKVAAIRKTSVCEVLGRNVGRSEDSVEREQFLQEKLHVPRPWIAEAKAVYASTVGNYGDQAWYLIQARLWNAAHEVTVKQIAPDAIINDNYSYLYDLLHELSSATSVEGFKEDSALKFEGQAHSTKIIDWNSKGRVFYDFINIDMEIKELLKKRDEQSVGYHIEKLRPQVTSLCSRINSLPISTAKERLCQSEIAKKVAHLIRAVLSLEASTSANSNISQSRVLAGYLAQLPLPDDYELQELRTLSRMYMLELMDSS